MSVPLLATKQLINKIQQCSVFHYSSINFKICDLIFLRKVGSGWVCCHNARGRMRNRKSKCIVTTNSDWSVLMTIITWQFQFHLVNVSIVMVLTTPIVTSRDAPWQQELLPHNAHRQETLYSHTFNIGVFKSVKNDSNTIKHIYNDSGNIIEGCNVAFDASGCFNFPYKRWQWLALRAWWHALTFVAHEITWNRAYVA